MEKKAVQVREQRNEHMRLQSAYASVAGSLEAASQEKRTLQSRMHTLEAQARSDARLCRYTQKHAGSGLLSYPAVSSAFACWPAWPASLGPSKDCACPKSNSSASCSWSQPRAH